MLRGVLLHETLPLPYRVAAGLLLLFGQPAHRIAALRVDQVHRATDQDDGVGVRIRLAQDILDVPEPFAALLSAHLNTRPNLATAAHRESPWLFPGVSPGRHLSVGSLVVALRAAGIPALAGRTATWTDLVRDAPPQVLARALGISPTTAMGHAARASADWASYAGLGAPRRPQP